MQLRDPTLRSKFFSLNINGRLESDLDNRADFQELKKIPFSDETLYH